jgi:hypothetical protein
MGHRAPFLHISLFLSIFLGVAQHAFRYRNGHSDSSILDTEITLDPEIITNIKPAPERVIHRCKEYLRHPEVRAAEAPSVI